MLYGSFHPPSTFKAIPKSQLLRVDRIVSDTELKTKRLEQISNKFLQRGYPFELVNKEKQNIISRIGKSEPIGNKRNRNKDKINRLLFVTQYSTRSSQVNKIIRKYWHILQKCHPDINAFHEPPMQAYKRSPNIKDQLVRADVGSHKYHQKTITACGTEKATRLCISSIPRWRGDVPQDLKEVSCIDERSPEPNPVDLTDHCKQHGPLRPTISEAEYTRHCIVQTQGHPPWANAAEEEPHLDPVARQPRDHSTMDGHDSVAKSRVPLAEPSVLKARDGVVGLLVGNVKISKEFWAEIRTLADLRESGGPQHHIGGCCQDSCKKRCGDKPNKSYSCQCNEHCKRFDDCCDDYHICLYADPSSEKDVHQETLCQGRCGQKYKKKEPCHCNKKCVKFNNCCSDYETACTSSSSSSSSTSSSSSKKNSASSSRSDYNDISNEEIMMISEKMYKLDVNKATESDIILNKQEMAQHTGSKDDLCEHSLYEYVNEKLFSRPTYAAFIALLDNYDRKTGTCEAYTEDELKEQENFLNEIMKTKLMKELYLFFHHKGLYQTETEFIKDLQKMWFGLYSRSKGETDSSGFEHVFVGEVKKGKVSGFHSWIRFYLLEKNGMMDYYSYNFDGPWTSYPDVLGKQFHWDGFFKEVGTQFIGSSPEFDFSLYTLCFISRPGKKCKLSLGGHGLSIQTYTWTQSTYGKGKHYIATAYPVV
ncbi:uridylate-specific endoribonuclease-like [Bombina bombina]|uniref:uridylate-specific endoribonuclease-like n=1 Tax=Bombina bombina TaxID=8345 RepID=UPI00235A4D1A|nr:uridylate-specific endoribonuclease-like [Bombina bombina]